VDNGHRKRKGNWITGETPNWGVSPSYSRMVMLSVGAESPSSVSQRKAVAGLEHLE
jgi:hypothetical protein